MWQVEEYKHKLNIHIRDMAYSVCEDILCSSTKQNTT